MKFVKVFKFNAISNAAFIVRHFLINKKQKITLDLI